MAPERAVDYRYSLANERTFLAYVRTAVAFQVAGLGTLQFLTAAESLVRHGVGLVLVSAGVAVGVVGLQRRRAVERAMERGEALPPTRLAPVVVTVSLLVPLVAGVLLVAS